MRVERPSIEEPATLRFDLRSQAYKQDPFPTLARLRAEGSLVRVKLPLLGTVWLATTYEAVNDLLRDHQRFAQKAGASAADFLSRLLRWLPRSVRPITTHMLLRDEPDHRRLRSLVERAFLRQSVDALRPRLEALADEAVDRLVEQGARSPGGVDLLSRFARPFPLAVICELLGLPPEDRPKFTKWVSRLSSAGSLASLLMALPGVMKLVRYIREEIQRQTDRPRDGLLSALIQAEEAGDRLSEDELLAMVFLLLLAGHETTLHQIAGSLLVLFDQPESLRELTSDWSLAEPAVQELLRYLSFAQITKPRYAREDVVFQGRTIRRGDMLVACLASANTDPAHFEDPERFDIHRDPNRHVAFGAGIHVCLGAKLARAEVEIALHRLFTRLPGLRLAVPRPDVRFAERIGARGLTSLPVVWDDAAVSA